MLPLRSDTDTSIGCVQGRDCGLPALHDTLPIQEKLQPASDLICSNIMLHHPVVYTSAEKHEPHRYRTELIVANLN